ncbi:MAG: hypothetical protein ACR2QC_09880, partial [Gammaproteobacteria bacterium]
LPPPPPRDSLILRAFRVLAVLLAAILGTTAANAQQAEAQVYSVPTDTFLSGGRTVNLGAPLTTIMSVFANGASFSNGFGQFLARLEGGNILAANPNLDNGLPTFGAPVAMGDRIRISNPFIGGVLITVRVYRDANGDFAFADGEEPPGRIAAASVLVADEFFLTDDWRYSPVAVRGAQGYAGEPTCDPDGLTPRLSDDGSTCLAAAVAIPPAASVSVSAPGGDSDSNARDLAVVGLGLGVVGFMAAYLSESDFSLFNFAPDYGYSLTESGYAYNVGGRLNFRKDNWHLYYAAGQGNANGNFGDFRYESGGKYSADLWTAAFSETVQSETADYDFSLSADWESGIWKVSPTYRLHSHFADEEFDTQNSLNLRGELLWNRWTISPSAGFRWESADEFGDNARFNLSAVRRF